MATKSGNKCRGVTGRIQSIAHSWHVEFIDATGVGQRLPVSDEDAWNFDIEHNLPVIFRLRLGKVQLLSRKGNKRFVTVAKVN